MASKRSALAACSGDPVKKRKTISLETKLEVLRRAEAHEGHTYIGRALGLSESTVRTIIKHRNSIKSLCTSDAVGCSGNIFGVRYRNRSEHMIHMERLLNEWCNEKNHGRDRTGVNQAVIREKALLIFDKLKSKYPDSDKNFTASNGWFEKFVDRYNLHSVKKKGEAASADENAATTFPAIIEDIIVEGGYGPQQVYNADETGLYWKKMPDRTYISKEEKSAPGFKVAKDRFTLLLGSNAAGDHKLKPLLVYHSENPRALKGFSKSHLPIIWKANRKGWITMALFSDWFRNHFVPAVTAYNKRHNLDNKALLILDNAPGHPTELEHMFENIKVVFLPKNTTSLLQPMDQGIISTLKAYYLRRTFRQLIAATDGDEKPTIREVWKSYNIKHAIDNIAVCWEEIAQSSLRGVWKKVCPFFTEEFKGFEPGDDHLEDVTVDIVAMGHGLGFDELDSGDIQKLLDSHSVELTAEEIVENDNELCSALQEEEEEVTEPRNEMEKKDISKFFSLINEAFSVLDENDPNEERRNSVIRGMKRECEVYKNLLQQKKPKQIKLDTFFKATNNESAGSSEGSV